MEENPEKRGKRGGFGQFSKKRKKEENQVVKIEKEEKEEKKRSAGRPVYSQLNFGNIFPELPFQDLLCMYEKRKVLCTQHNST